MPGIVIAFFTFVLIFIFFAFALPILAVHIAAGIIGNRAKITNEEKRSLKIKFYFVTGAFVGLSTAMMYTEGPISFVFQAVLGAFIWPIGIALEATGSFAEDEGSSLAFYGSVVLGFVVTQILAVRMILQRADRETELD